LTSQSRLLFWNWIADTVTITRVYLFGFLGGGGRVDLLSRWRGSDALVTVV